MRRMDIEMTYSDLAGKVVVVTGGSRGIGAETAREFGAEGARVCVVGRDQSAIDEVVASIVKDGGTAIGVAADVTDLAAIEQVRTRTEAEFGPADVVAAFAGGGIARPGPTASMSEQEWHSVVDGNLTATFLTLKSFLPGMEERRRGSIITMASSAGRVPSNLPGDLGGAPGPSRSWGAPVAYAAAKAGIVMLTRHVAAEVGQHSVRVNCIAPAAIRTERTAHHMGPETLARVAAMHPMGRIGETADVARTALFLASDAASWLTGLTIDVAGGRVTTP
jgi:3-oxoacyl-[acyl-carrier protein] reductase